MIFNLFKSKPKLKEIIPNGFVDIHSHILPGIDDGAKNIDESLSLISKMKKLGFSKIIGTPHTYPGLYNNTTNTIKKSYEKIINKKPKGIELNYASEYFIDSSLIHKAQKKKLLCFNKNYVLAEMSFISEPIRLFEIIYEMNLNGYTTVIAHPERYLFFNDIKKYFKLKKLVAFFRQICYHLLTTMGLR